MDPNDALHRGDWQQGFGRDDARSDNATWGWVAQHDFCLAGHLLPDVSLSDSPPVRRRLKNSASAAATAAAK
jgi:hypothetical protein